MFEIVVIAGTITALREILGFFFNAFFNGRKKTIDYMANKIITHDAVKKPLESHEQRLNAIETKIDDIKSEFRDCFLIMLENTLRRYYYELTETFNPTIYRDCFLKIKEPYKAKGGNGIVDIWDDVLKNMYKKHLQTENQLLGETILTGGE